MKSSSSKIRLISILCALSLFAVQPGFAATKSVTKLKSAGRTANSIPNTILNGTGAPSKTIGINGDFYIDTKNLNIYGPKKKNAWPLPISLRGTAGTDGKAGNAGVAGVDGKTITNSAVGGGTAGASGITSATVGVFTFINPLTGTAGAGAQSHNFGGMLAGKKYLMHLVISGVHSSYEDILTTLILRITSTAGVIPITTAYFVSTGKSFNVGTRITQNISAELVIDGTLVVDTFNLYATVTATDDLATSLTLSGYFSLTEVGSIT